MPKLSKDHITRELKRALPGLLARAEGLSYPFQLSTIHGWLLIAPDNDAIRTFFLTAPATTPVGAPLGQHSSKWNHEDIKNLAETIGHFVRIAS